jgi:hypothetical protein
MVRSSLGGSSVEAVRDGRTAPIYIKIMIRQSNPGILELPFLDII